MKIQVMKISDWQNQYTCIRDTEQEQEYALYYHYNAPGRNGYITKHKKLIGRFYSMYAVLNELKDRVVA
jgi:hypothetical protein